MKNLFIIFLSALLLCACGNPAKESFTVGGVQFNMILVEEGSFSMGGTPEQGEYFLQDELPVHTVHLTPYYIGETQVTQALWEAVMGTTIDDLAQEASDRYASLVVADDTSEENLRLAQAVENCSISYGKSPDHPVYYVSWYQAQEFCQRLSEMTGREFYLPTEAQWAFAARGGREGKNYLYSGSSNMHEVGWVDELRTEGGTHPVAQKMPNEIGLYDMTGNVWEWCSDWYAPYTLATDTNPEGPEVGETRVMRGSSWRGEPHTGRIANRAHEVPEFQHYTVGFRLAMRCK